MRHIALRSRLHKETKNAFDQLGVKKLPKVKDLSAEYAQVLTKKKATYAEYRAARFEMQEYQKARHNVEVFFEMQQEQKETQMQQEQQHNTDR